ncbi:hypothetical protein SAMN05216489_09992 [Streptomyces sp. 3213]|uniref:hypothetical protein n=1 Tax=Streptomyces sp. 3213.3 TaxID=1855348 RepID=UPI00089B46EB|nr:hypothetical protein [Streptomyces sp. 3213.3]SEF12942.1 hypothetical protein SAMN05216489_09992 [Streptomyces sp. 3213] [Streptomyces sp. 3213.3]
MSTQTIDAPAAPERLSAPETADEASGVPQGAPDATADTDAPYGRTATGRPRAKPGRKAKSAPTAPMPPRRRSSARTGPKANSRESVAGRYAETCKNLLRTLVTPLMIVGQRNDAVAADAAVLATAGPELCDALGDLAAEEAWVAAKIDKLMAVGPYGAVGTALLLIFAQLSYNHGAIPANVAGHMGLTDPATLAAGVKRAGAAAADPQRAAEAQRKAQRAYANSQQGV